MTEMARTLILIGIVFVVVGLALSLVGKIPWLGKLPGDILIKKENTVFYFPLTTCILVSIILSFILYLWQHR